MNKVEELVETRINGNSIKGNSTYEKMLRSVTKEQVAMYGHSVGCSITFGSKLERIEQIKNHLTRRY